MMDGFTAGMICVAGILTGIAAIGWGTTSPRMSKAQQDNVLTMSTLLIGISFLGIAITVVVNENGDPRMRLSLTLICGLVGLAITVIGLIMKFAPEETISDSQSRLPSHQR